MYIKQRILQVNKYKIPIVAYDRINCLKVNYIQYMQCSR